ncbi:hypothetical protein RE432_18375 [Pusillimonas sp. SM2304]|nr:hypothetical protein [Pusillimonas sp. SM2304]MDS1142404.1 hypothetical protein [Pusillimonas sp. SM2304]
MQILAIIGGAVLFIVILAAIMWSMGVLEVGFDIEFDDEDE